MINSVVAPASSSLASVSLWKGGLGFKVHVVVNGNFHPKECRKATGNSEEAGEEGRSSFGKKGRKK